MSARRHRTEAQERARLRRRRKVAARRERWYQKHKAICFYVSRAAFERLPWRIRLRLQREFNIPGGRRSTKLVDRVLA